MDSGFYAACAGLRAQSQALEVAAHNLANLNTTGFRSRRLQFQDLIYQNMEMPGSASSQQTTVAAGLQIGWARALPRPRSSSCRAT